VQNIEQEKLVEGFVCPTLSAQNLRIFLNNLKINKPRRIQSELTQFCAVPANKILGVYGLRRTGKSVMMCSVALGLMEQGKRVVYFDFERNRTMRFKNLMQDLELCKERNVEYVFIDEITFLTEKVIADLTGEEYYVPEFPERGMEIYAITKITGMHIIVSGTDSYCLSLAKGDSLFDRMKFLHTTHIPYREYVDLVGNLTVSEYLEKGGVLYRPEDEDWSEYLRTAIINNILVSIGAIHPVRSKYRYIIEMNSDEIKSLILYTLSMNNIEFIEQIFRRAYRFPELYDGVDLSRKGRPPVFIPEDFINSVREGLRREFNLTHLNENSLKYMLAEMKQVLEALDVLTPYTLEVVTRLDGRLIPDQKAVYALSVPGLRAYQINKTSDMVRNTVYEELSKADRETLLNKISESAEGHLIESLILSETARRLPKDFKVSQYRISDNEVDLVIEHTKTNRVSLFEIKRSGERTEEQTKHFTESSFVPDLKEYKSELTISSFNVLYNGESCAMTYTHRITQDAVTVNYINIGDYLLCTPNHEHHENDMPKCPV
jgi:predicted AAA+ superfamily ATPase